MFKGNAVSQEGKNIFSITAAEHYNEKFDALETKDYQLGIIPDSAFPETEPEEIPPPTNLEVTFYVQTLLIQEEN